MLFAWWISSSYVFLIYQMLKFISPCPRKMEPGALFAAGIFIPEDGMMNTVFSWQEVIHFSILIFIKSCLFKHITLLGPCSIQFIQIFWVGCGKWTKSLFFSDYLCNDTIERLIYDFNPTNIGDTVRAQVLSNFLHLLTASLLGLIRYKSVLSIIAASLLRIQMEYHGKPGPKV